MENFWFLYVSLETKSIGQNFFWKFLETEINSDFFFSETNMVRDYCLSETKIDRNLFEMKTSHIYSCLDLAFSTIQISTEVVS